MFLLTPPKKLSKRPLKMWGVLWEWEWVEYTEKSGL